MSEPPAVPSVSGAIYGIGTDIIQIERVEGVGVEVQVRAHAFEQRGGFVELDRGRVEHRVDFEQARFVFSLAREFVAHLLQLAAQRRTVFAAEFR